MLVQGNLETGLEAHTWLRKVPFIEALARLGLTSASRILVLNEGLLTWVRSFGGANAAKAAEVLPTGVSDVYFAAPSSPSAVGGDYAIFVGNFAAWQGISYILSAIKDPSWPAELRVIFVGDGVDAPLVEEACGRSVDWLGRLRPDEVAPLLSGALFSLCTKMPVPSMSETTTPFKMLESVAAGVPVVATDIPAQRRMVAEGGYGILVDPASPNSLARAASRLVREKALRSELALRAIAVSPSLRWNARADQLSKAIFGRSE